MDIYFLIKEDDLLNKCNTIWDKTSTDAKIELSDEPVYNKKIFRTKTKFYILFIIDILLMTLEILLIILMKNKLKLNIRMIFEEAILKIEIYCKILIYTEKNF